MITTNTVDRIRLLFRKEKEPFLQLYKILGFFPRNIEPYKEALMHKSYARWHKGRHNNERLEFLGDAVLGAVVADILYEHYGRKQEGFLTTVRSKIVKRETLNKLAVKIGIDKFVKHSGPVTSAHNSHMNGNAFEAFIGAIYIDRGYSYCKKFMQEKVFKHYIDIEKTASLEENFKSRLIEWCQKYQLDFKFDTESSFANDGHTPKFSTKIYIESVLCGSGQGYSKKESHQKASREAMKKIRNNNAFVNSIIEAKSNRRQAEKDQELAENNQEQMEKSQEQA